MTVLKAITLFVLLAPTLSVAEMLRGRVVSVYDGDTVTVAASEARYKIRVAGIDAPELKQAGGRASRDALRAAVLHQVVVIEWNKKDRYGRIVGKVWRRHRDAGLAQLRGGWAWHYKKYLGEQSARDRSVYARAERNARAAHRGLWADAAPVAPWEFRRGR